MKAILKKTTTTFALASLLFISMPKNKAYSGIILLPSIVSIVLLIQGAIHGSTFLVLLDDEGSDQLSSKLEQRYSGLTDNQLVFDNLAHLIYSKYDFKTITTDTKLDFAEEEINAALGASILNEELVNAIQRDFL